MTEQIIEIDSLRQALEGRAIYLLSLREHGRKELAYKLSQKFPEAEKVPGLVTDILEKCEQEGWLSDERYIEAYVRQALEKGHGPFKIQQNLQMRTERDDLVQAYLSMEDSEWAEIAKQVLLKKYGETTKPKARNEQAKRMRFLQSRGFSPTHVWKAFE